MSRINTNINSLIAQRVVGQQNANLSQSLQRLSTGYRINRGADDPAGLIASEVLRGEKASISAAIGNAERADQFVNVAEGGLNEINALLVEVQSLVGQSANDAGLSQEEKEANQLQIDNILQTIDRIASTTSFQGSKLLNGSFDFQVTGQGANVTNLTVNNAKLDGTNNVAVTALVTQSAQHGTLFLSVGAAALDLSAADADFSFELAGIEGSKSFSFGSGATLASIATQINTFKDVTGVSAVASGNYIELKSTEFGKDEFVSLNVTNAGGQAGGVKLGSALNEAALNSAAGTAFTAITTPIRDEGQDIAGTINGTKALGKGTNLSINSETLALNATLNATGATTLGTQAIVTITGGGAKFNLGAEVNLNNQVQLGIQNASSTALGKSTLDGTSYSLSDLAGAGSLNVIDGDSTKAQKVVNAAIKGVATQRGRLGAFQKNVVGSTINSLNVALENISAAESTIRDTDFAKETSELTRSQVLAAAANNVLSIANAQPQSVLGLLG
ncbi:MAG: flagellin [Phycisphaerales bacterium JB063]